MRFKFSIHDDGVERSVVMSLQLAALLNLDHEYGVWIKCYARTIAANLKRPGRVSPVSGHACQNF
jgi:hypothetical protein